MRTARKNVSVHGVLRRKDLTCLRTGLPGKNEFRAGLEVFDALFMRHVEAQVREKNDGACHELRRCAGGVRYRPDAIVVLLLGMDGCPRTLEARLAKNSSNSSKPPSSDIVKPKGKKCKKGKRKADTQPGLPIPFLEDEIDRFPDYRLDACPGIAFLDQPPRVIQQMELIHP